MLDFMGKYTLGNAHIPQPCFTASTGFKKGIRSNAYTLSIPSQLCCYCCLYVMFWAFIE